MENWPPLLRYPARALNGPGQASRENPLKRPLSAPRGKGTARLCMTGFRIARCGFAPACLEGQGGMPPKQWPEGNGRTSPSGHYPASLCQSTEIPGLPQTSAWQKKGPRNYIRSPFHLLKRPYAFLAISVSCVKAAASLTASSASILRLISTPAVFRPCIKVE